MKRGKLLRTLAEVAEFWKAAGHVLVDGLTHTSAERQMAALPPGRMRVWAKQVRLYFDPEVVLHLVDLSAEIAIDDPDLPLIPEKTDQYSFHLVSGTLRLSAASIQGLLGKYLFPATGIPLHNPHVTLDDRGMRLAAELSWGPVTVPITLAGPMRLADGGALELVAARVEAAGWGLGPLLGLLRTDLERVLHLSPDGPVHAAGNRLRIDPERIFPSPRAIGRPVAVSVEGGDLVLQYASAEAPPAPPLLTLDHDSYLFCLGHSLLVGKMFLQDAVFQVVPRDLASDVLDFSLTRYRQQLAAGESTMKPHGELLVRLPNLAELELASGVAEPYPKLNGRLVIGTQRDKIRKRQPR